MLLELGRAEARAGDPEAIAHLERAMAEARDARLAAQAALELAPVLKFAGESVRAVAVTERALERLGDADPALAEQLEVELFGSAYISIAARTLLAPRLAALPRAAAVTDDATSTASGSTGIAFDAFAAGRPADEVADLATRGLAYGALATDPTAGGHAFVSGAIALMFAERYDEADRLYSGALDDARRRGSGIAFATASSLRSLVAYRRGRLAEALADASAALELADDGARLPGLPGRGAGHARLHRARPGHRGRRPRGVRRALRARAGRRHLPYSHAMHAAPACASTAASWSRPTRSCWPRAGASWSGARATRPSRPGARPPRSSPTSSGTCAPRGSWRSRRSSWRGRSARRARSASRCAPPGSWPDASRGIALLAEAVAVLERSLGALEHARALIDHGLALAAVGARISPARGSPPGTRSRSAAAPPRSPAAPG